jgi:ABC-type Na+ transport system ATPase subunit NatA
VFLGVRGAAEIERTPSGFPTASANKARQPVGRRAATRAARAGADPEPALLVLDEPTTGLDVAGKETRAHHREFAKASGTMSGSTTTQVGEIADALTYIDRKVCSTSARSARRRAAHPTWRCRREAVST